MRICFDPSVSETLKACLLEADELFAEADAAAADVVLFETDDYAQLAASPLWRAHRAKSFCISETDTPTFALPGLYAANRASPLTVGRTETISYFISERARGNAAVRAMVGQAVEKRYLYSFLGGSNSWARKRLFRCLAEPRPDTVVEATNGYFHWSEQGAEAKARQQDRYALIMAQSKFSLCPRGCGLSSYRLFEGMSLGVAPVIIADGWRPIAGIDWSFALFLPESKLAEVDGFVRAHEDEWEARGAAARAAYQTFLTPERIAELVQAHLWSLLQAYDPRREAMLAPVLRTRVAVRDGRWAAFKAVKPALLEAMRLARLRSPVMLRQPLEEQIAHHRANR